MRKNNGRTVININHERSISSINDRSEKSLSSLSDVMTHFVPY